MGMAHRQDRMAQRDWDGFDRVNHRATRSLAEEIRRHPSIKRFIYISSVAVHGTRPTVPLTESSPPAPDTPYGQSKWNAEQAIQGILDPVQFPWVILRPVLVYGPGNPGNMARLAGMLNRGWPVPVTRVPNRRSFLYIGNLTDAIGRCLESCPAPAGRTWLVADRETPSTAALVQALGRAAGRPPRTLALPPGLWKASARLGDLLSRAGLPCPWNEEVRGKLLDDFQVDATAIRNDLPWDPPYSFLQGIGLTFAGQANGTGCG